MEERIAELQERIAEFRRQYDNIDPDYIGLRLPPYEFSETTERRRFQDPSTREWFSFINTEVTIQFSTELVPTYDAMGALEEFVEYFTLVYGRDRTLYQINFANAAEERYSNLHPTSWIEELYGRMGLYDDGEFVTTSISLRFTNRNIPLSNMISGDGDGVSIRHKDWILFDLMKSKGDCVLNSFVSWLYYSDSRLDELLGKTIDELNAVKNEYKNQLNESMPYRFRDMQKIHAHDMHIVTDLNELEQFDEQSSVKSCMYYYSNNHCYLILHKNKISGSEWRKLRRLIQQTTVAYCKKKYPKRKCRKYYTMDIESYRRPSSTPNEVVYVHEPLVVGLFSGKFQQFIGEDAIKQTLNWLYETNEDCIVWAHNGGKYDWHFLFEVLSEFVDINLMEPVKMCDLNGALIQLQCYLKNGRIITFKDSYRLLPASLSKLGRDFNVKHQKAEDLNIEEATREELLTNRQIHHYNEIDCIALYEVLEAYKEMITTNFDMNPLEYVSAASFAKGLYYSKFFDPSNTPIYVPSKPVYDFIRIGYSGGRNEVFTRGIVKGPLYSYDFTSLYPKAGTLLLPYGKPVHLPYLTIPHERQVKFLKDNPGFYEVHITSPKNVLPLHGIKKKGKFMFPEFALEKPEQDTTVLFSEEIIMGLNLGYKYTFVQGYKFKLAYIMKDSFEALFQLRKQAIADGNHALAQALKITINSMYGFHGFQKYNRNVLKTYGCNYESHLAAKEQTGGVHYKRYGDIFLAQERVDIHLEDVNIAVAAAITSHARMILYNLMEDIKRVGGEIHYVDTDSIITNYRIEDNSTLKEKYMLNDGKEMGELKNELESSHANEAVFITCKTYGYTQILPNGDTKTLVKAKGIKVSDIQPEEVGMVKPLPSEKEKCSELTKRRHESMYRTLKVLLSHPVEANVSIICTSRRNKVTNTKAHVYDKIQKKIVSGIYHKGIVTAIPYGETSSRIMPALV